MLLVREAPFNLAHLRNMVAVTEMGGIVFPPVPAYYQQPQSLDEATRHTVQRVLNPRSTETVTFPIRTRLIDRGQATQTAPMTA